MACCCLSSIIYHVYSLDSRFSIFELALSFAWNNLSYSPPSSTPPALPPNVVQPLCILWSQCQVHFPNGAFPAPRYILFCDTFSCSLQQLGPIQVKFLLNVRFLLAFRLLEDRDAVCPVCSCVSTHTTNNIKE